MDKIISLIIQHFLCRGKRFLQSYTSWIIRHSDPYICAIVFLTPSLRTMGPTDGPLRSCPPKVNTPCRSLEGGPQMTPYCCFHNRLWSLKPVPLGSTAGQVEYLDVPLLSGLEVSIKVVCFTILKICTAGIALKQA